MRYKTRIWHAKDGTDWQIRQMSSEHILNCIKLIHLSLMRGRRWRVRYLKPLERELARRATILLAAYGSAPNPRLGSVIPQLLQSASQPRLTRALRTQTRMEHLLSLSRSIPSVLPLSGYGQRQTERRRKMPLPSSIAS